MPRPAFIQAPTLKQQVAMFNLVRKGRKIVSKGELTPDDAVEFRHLMDVADREFELPACNDNRTEFDRDLDVIREVLNSEPRPARALACDGRGE